jgi:hypothetical protein
MIFFVLLLRMECLRYGILLLTNRWLLFLLIVLNCIPFCNIHLMWLFYSPRTVFLSTVFMCIEILMMYNNIIHLWEYSKGLNILKSYRVSWLMMAICIYLLMIILLKCIRCWIRVWWLRRWRGRIRGRIIRRRKKKEMTLIKKLG